MQMPNLHVGICMAKEFKILNFSCFLVVVGIVIVTNNTSSYKQTTEG
jgi:hypothetical protein